MKKLCGGRPGKQPRTDAIQAGQEEGYAIHLLLDCKPAPGETRVVYPGIPEHEEEQIRRDQGIPYHPEVIDWYRTTMTELGVPCELP